jgi:hypothetical protein
MNIIEQTEKCLYNTNRPASTSLLFKNNKELGTSQASHRENPHKTNVEIKSVLSLSCDCHMMGSFHLPFLVRLSSPLFPCVYVV